MLERDAGYQCPDPPQYFQADGSLRLVFHTDRFPVSGTDFNLVGDLRAFLGGNNDPVALFSFPNTAAIEALNGTVIAGQDADVAFRNRGFLATQIPPLQDPYVR